MPPFCTSFGLKSGWGKNRKELIDEQWVLFVRQRLKEREKENEKEKEGALHGIRNFRGSKKAKNQRAIFAALFNYIKIGLFKIIGNLGFSDF